MKAYNDYMDNISVSDALHRRFVSCATNVRSTRLPTMARRYAMAFTCLAVILLGIFTVPQMLPNNMAPVPSGNPPVSQPGVSASVPDSSDEYALIFNKAGSQRPADKIYIRGHFWQELTSDELQKVFPSLTDTHIVTATVNFQRDEAGAALFNIDAHAVSASGLKTYIQIAPGKAVVDYVLNSDVKTSDILGTAVTAGYFESKPNSKGLRNVIYFASFNLSDLGYYVELSGGKSESAALRDEFSLLIGLLIRGSAADLSIFDNPVIPELREDELNLSEAYADPDFGAYLPQDVPSGFAFESAMRFINQRNNYLVALWAQGMTDIHWRVSVLAEDDKARITPVADTQNYDLSLYPIPRADSVPHELREILDNPIFRIEDLTLEAVQSRAYEVSDKGDISGPHMRFSVLYGDTLAEINVKGATPEAIFEMLQQIKK